MKKKITPEAVPPRERNPRVEHPNFYWEHEDYLKERKAARAGNGTWLVVVILSLTCVFVCLLAVTRVLAVPGDPGGPVWHFRPAGVLSVSDFVANRTRLHE